MPHIAKKSLGQHFLRCAWVGHTLINAADVSLNDTILEVGPGTGALTRLLAARAGRVIAIEKDERLARALTKDLQSRDIKNVEIIPGDVLKLCSGLSPEHEYKIVANIPYYLTSRLIRVLLEQKNKPVAMALTIQKEVAERMCEKPPRMNMLAIAVQAYGKPEIIKTVPADCFSPKPKVESAIITLSDISDRYFKTYGISEDNFFTLLKSAFSQKRKILLNTLPLPKSKSAELLRRLGFSPNARAEELSLAQWAEIMRLF